LRYCGIYQFISQFGGVICASQFGHVMLSSQFGLQPVRQCGNHRQFGGEISCKTLSSMAWHLSDPLQPSPASASSPASAPPPGNWALPYSRRRRRRRRLARPSLSLRLTFCRHLLLPLHLQPFFHGEWRGGTRPGATGVRTQAFRVRVVGLGFGATGVCTQACRV